MYRRVCNKTFSVLKPMHAGAECFGFLTNTKRGSQRRLKLLPSGVLNIENLKENYKTSAITGKLLRVLENLKS